MDENTLFVRTKIKLNQSVFSLSSPVHRIETNTRGGGESEKSLLLHEEMKMKQIDKKMCSSSSSSCSSSYMVLWVLAPLVFITGVVLLLGPKSSNWVSLSSYNNYTPWGWSGGGSSFLPSTLPPSSSNVHNNSFEIKMREEHVDFDERDVGGPSQNEEEEVVSSSSSNVSSFSQSSNSTTLAKQSIEIKDLDEREQMISNRSMNDSNAIPEVRIRARQDSKLEQLEASLARARAVIREAAKNHIDLPDPDYVPQGPVYCNSHAFHRSYLEMERQFKVYIYEEGEPPVFHNGPCKSIYSTEGNFIHMMEVEPQMQTLEPDKAHVYFLPFSVTMMVRYVYVRDSHDFGPIKRTVTAYVDDISQKYPYWNRSLGADHFMLSCHDWVKERTASNLLNNVNDDFLDLVSFGVLQGPEASKQVPNLYKNSIRALCNANTSEGFNPSKDVSLPEINLVTGDINGWVGGPSPSKRPILAFFAGGLHGPIRPILLEHWENKDAEIQVHKYLPRGVSYHEMMKKSKFCLCPSGYEVASPRIVEALYEGCVPVLISDHYVPPFSDVLNWKSFSVEVPVREIPNLKNILIGISPRQYIRMQRRGLIVRKHFEVNSPPKRFDVFYMILHSIWLRRLNIHVHD